MGSEFYMIMAFSPAFPALAGAILYSRVNEKVYPFIYAMWLSLITEVIAAILLRVYDNMYASLNIYFSYVCVNIVLYSLFFFRMGVISSKRNYWILTGVCISACLGALFFTQRIYTLFSASLFCAIVIGGLSINMLSRQILAVREMPYKSFSFLMSMGAVIFNSFFIFLVANWFLGKDDSFKTDVYSVQKFVSAITYIIFGISILCLPKTLKSSR
jgi:hypothetical protein